VRVRLQGTVEPVPLLDLAAEAHRAEQHRPVVPHHAGRLGDLAEVLAAEPLQQPPGQAGDLRLREPRCARHAWSSCRCDRHEDTARAPAANSTRVASTSQGSPSIRPAPGPPKPPATSSNRFAGTSQLLIRDRDTKFEAGSDTIFGSEQIAIMTGASRERVRGTLDRDVPPRMLGSHPHPGRDVISDALSTSTSSTTTNIDPTDRCYSAPRTRPTTATRVPSRPAPAIRTCDATGFSAASSANTATPPEHHDAACGCRGSTTG